MYVRDGRLMASADAGDGPGDSVELTPIDRNRFIVPHTPIVSLQDQPNHRPEYQRRCDQMRLRMSLIELA